MVNSQDGGGLANALSSLATMTDNQSKETTSTKDIQDYISRLTAGLQKLEQEIRDMRLQQQNLDSLLATKIAAHMEPIREETNRTFLDQQMKFGADLEELKQYWTAEQDKRDLARKREVELKELEQRKLRLEQEQEQSRAQAAQDDELLRQITAATALVTREVVTSMSVTSQNDYMSRLTITTLHSQEDDTNKHTDNAEHIITPQKGDQSQTGPPSGGQL